VRYSITPLGGSKQTVEATVGRIVKYLIGDDRSRAPDRHQTTGQTGVAAPSRYYADGGDEPGRWRGNGAAALGLHGQVDARDFAQALAGRDPHTGERLITAQGSAGRRPRLGVGSETRWDDWGGALYDERDAASALNVEAKELEALLNRGTSLAASRVFSLLSHGTGNGAGQPGMVKVKAGMADPTDGSYLVPVVDLDGTRWVADTELTRLQNALATGVDPDEVLASGNPDDVLPLAEAARLAGVTPRYLRDVAARYEDERSTIEEIVASGAHPRKAYMVARRGPGRRWFVTRGELVAFLRRRRPPTVIVGYDITLTTEKSLSLLALLAEPHVGAEVLDAIQDANDQAIGWLEDNAASARSKGERIAVKGWMVASFRHLTSRALDPFAHWHNVVPNTVEDARGVRRALDARGLYASAKAAAAIATADARWRVTHKLGVRWRPGRKGGWEIAGLDDPLLIAFSKRRNDVDDAVRELEEEMSRGVRPDEIEALVLKTRPPKESKAVEELRAEWWRQANELGLRPADLAGCIGHALPTGPPDDDWLYERLAQPDGICSNLSVFDLGDVLAALCDMPIPQPDGTPAQPLIVTGARLQELAAGFLASRYVVEIIDGGNPTYTTTEILGVQQRIVDRYVAGRRLGSAAVVNKSTIDSVLKGHTLLTVEQRRFVRRLCASGQRLQHGIGYPGAGKTTTMAAARDAWEQGGFRVVGAAVTGEAARLLAEATRMRTETLAWWLTHEDPMTTPLNARTVLVVDEASTISDRDLDRLGWLCVQTGAALRLIGDPGQHSAVEAGGMFRVLCERFPADAPKLTETHRVQDPNDRAAADALRRGDIGSALDNLQLAGHLHIVDDEADFYRQMLVRWWAARQAGEHHPMVDGRNAVRRRLNRLAHRLLQAMGEVGTDEVAADGERGFALGDQVIAREPARHLNPAGRPDSYVRNRSAGVVTALRRGNHPEDDVIVVDFDGIGTVHLPRTYFDAHETASGAFDVGLDHGYAVTSYAVQGSTKKVSTSRIDQRSTRAEMLVDITRGQLANHVYLTRSGDALDDEQLPRIPPPPIDHDLVAKLSRSAGEITAWELLNPAQRGKERTAIEPEAVGL
jgi:conjugative relaxase-like TrwC/TraI family protein